LYDWGNSTAVNANNYTMLPGTYPNKVANVVNMSLVADFAHNNSIVGVNYSYSCDYGSSTTLRTIYENIPVMVALGLLFVAGIAFMLK
jgi:hypothetical protein